MSRPGVVSSDRMSNSRLDDDEGVVDLDDLDNFSDDDPLQHQTPPSQESFVDYRDDAEIESERPATALRRPPGTSPRDSASRSKRTREGHAPEREQGAVRRRVMTVASYDEDGAPMDGTPVNGDEEEACVDDSLLDASIALPAASVALPAAAAAAAASVRGGGGMFMGERAPPDDSPVEALPDDDPRVMEAFASVLNGHSYMNIDWTPEIALGVLDAMETLWRIDPDAGRRDMTEEALDLFEYPRDARLSSISYEDLDKVRDRYIRAVIVLSWMLENQNVRNRDPGPRSRSRYRPSIRLRTILWRVKEAYNYIRSAIGLHKSMNDSHTLSDVGDADLMNIRSFEAVEVSNKDPASYILVQHMLEEFQKRQLGRMNGLPYVQKVVTTEDGKVFPTRFWEPLTDEYGKQFTELKQVIYSFVNQHTDKPVFLEMCKSKGVVETSCEILRYSKDPMFPELRRSRYIFAFRNGLFDVRTCRFYRWADPEIPSDVVACNFFDSDFGRRPDGEANPDLLLGEQSFMDVETEALDLLHLFQLEEKVQTPPREPGDTRTDEELRKAEIRRVLAWIYAFYGRLLFLVGERDNWQVMPVLIGVAGTGKSTILDALSFIFPVDMVKTLGSGGSAEKYSAASIMGGFLWMCPEMSSTKFAIEQEQLQSMISGERTPVRDLYKQSITVVWEVPGIAAGNHLPQWADNSGSMSRRLVMIPFDRIVPPSKKKQNLKESLRQNVDRILYKIAMAYHWAVRNYGDKDIWKTAGDPVLPRFFHNARRLVKIQTNPVAMFLSNSQDLKFDPNRDKYFEEYSTLALKSKKLPVPRDGRLMMPFSRFQELCNEYMNTFLNPKDREGFAWGKTDKYITVFAENNLCLVSFSGDPLYMGAPFPRTQWVVGVSEYRPNETEQDLEDAAEYALARASEAGSVAGPTQAEPEQQDEAQLTEEEQRAMLEDLLAENDN